MPDRREFLHFLAASPILAAAGLDVHRLRDLTSASPARAGKGSFPVDRRPPCLKRFQQVQ